MPPLCALRNVRSTNVGLLTAEWACRVQGPRASIRQRGGAIKPGPAFCKVENRTDTELHQPRHRVMRDSTTRGGETEACGVLKPQLWLWVLLLWLHVSWQLLAMLLSNTNIKFFGGTYRDNFLCVYRLWRHPSWTDPDLPGSLQISTNQTFYPVIVTALRKLVCS